MTFCIITPISGKLLCLTFLLNVYDRLLGLVSDAATKTINSPIKNYKGMFPIFLENI